MNGPDLFDTSGIFNLAGEPLDNSPSAEGIARAQAQAQAEANKAQRTFRQLTCERCGRMTDAGAWLGFVYVGAECLTTEDKENLEDDPENDDCIQAERRHAGLD